MESFVEKYYEATSQRYLEFMNNLAGNMDKEGFEFSRFGTSLYTTFGLWLHNGEGVKKHNFLIDDFGLVVFLFWINRRKIKKEDLVKMLLYMVKRNIDNGILSDKKYSSRNIINTNLLNSLSSIVEASLDLKKSELDRVVYVVDTNLLNNESNSNRLYGLSCFLGENLSMYRKMHKKIKEHYFDKKDCFDSADIVEIVAAFEKLNNSLGDLEESGKFAISCVSEVLEKEVAMRETRNEVVNPCVVQVSEKTKTEKNVKFSLSKGIKKNANVVCSIPRDKKTYETRKKIEKIFDFDSEELKKEILLNYSDILYYSSMMNQVGFSEEERFSFVKAAYHRLMNTFTNPYEVLNNLRRKLSFYQVSGVEVDETFETIQQFLPEYMSLKIALITNKERENELRAELDEWEEILKTEFAKLKSYVPKSGEYEQMEIKKMMNVK